MDYLRRASYRPGRLRTARERLGRPSIDWPGRKVARECLEPGMTMAEYLQTMEALRVLLGGFQKILRGHKTILGKLGHRMADVIDHTADRVERAPWMAFDYKLPPEDVPTARECAQRIRLNADKMMLPDGVPEEV